MREPRISGAVVLDQRAAYEEIFGAEVVARAIARLPPGRREEFEELLPITWCRCSTWIAVITAIADELGRDPLGLSKEVTERGLERTFHGLWRLLLRFTSDRAMLARAATIWSKTFDTGTMSMEMIATGRAVLTLRGFAEVSEIDVQGTGIAIASILRLGARQNVRVTWRRTADGARYEASWS